MKARSCRRLMWKESVEMWPLGAATMLGVVMFQVLVAYFGKQLMGTRVDFTSLQSIGIKLPLIFGGAVSAAMFNREEDRKTLGFLQSLPMSAGEFYVGKVVPVIGWTMLLLAFGSASAWTVVRLFGEMTATRVPVSSQNGFLLTLASVGVVLILGVTCSLTFKDIFASLAVTAAATLACAIAAVAVIDSFSGHSGVNWLAIFLFGLPLSLLGFHHRLASRLLYRSGDTPLFSSRRVAESRDSRSLGRRLAWQHLLHVRRVAIAVFLWAFALACFVFVESPRTDQNIVINVLLVLICATLLSAQTFSVDQSRQGYRFLADRGVRPSTVWWSRICVSALLVVIAVAPCLTFGMISVDALNALPPGSFRAGISQSTVLGGLGSALLLLPILSFAVGQFYSQRVASPVLNLFCSSGTITPLAAWLVIVSVLGVPAIIHCLPLVAALVLASWLYMPNWLLGKRSWRYSWSSFAIPCLAVLVCYVGASLYRVYEIPAASLPASFHIPPPTETPIESSREAAAWTEWVEAQTRLDATFQIEWLTAAAPPFVRIQLTNKLDSIKADEELLAEILRAKHRFQFRYPDEVTFRDHSGTGLGRFLLAFARIRESQGKVGEAWTIYEHLFKVFDAMRQRATTDRWHLANTSEQWTHICLQEWALQANREQLQKAIDFLTPRTKRLEDLEQLVFDTRAVNQRRIRDPLASRLALDGGIATDRLFFLEQRRLERLVDRIAELELASVSRHNVRQWDYQASVANEQLFVSPTEVGRPVDLHKASEVVFVHRQASLVQMKVLLEFLDSPDKPLGRILDEVCEGARDVVDVTVVPSISNRTAEERTQYSDSWYDHGTLPSTWPCLLFPTPYGAIESIRVPLPPRPDAQSTSGKSHRQNDEMANSQGSVGTNSAE